jgi:hypothetical protein
VVDAKSTSSVHLSHRVQVTLYILLLREIFKDLNAGRLAAENIKFEVSDKGGIWLIDHMSQTSFQADQLESGIKYFIENEMWAEDKPAILHEQDCAGCFKLKDCLAEAEQNRSIDLLHGLPKSKKADLRKMYNIDNVLDKLDKSDPAYHKISNNVQAIIQKKYQFNSAVSSYLYKENTQFITIGFDMQKNFGLLVGSGDNQIYREWSKQEIIGVLHQMIRSTVGKPVQILMATKQEYNTLERILHTTALSDEKMAGKSWQVLCALFLSPQVLQQSEVPVYEANIRVVVVPQVLTEVAALPKLSPFWQIEDWMQSFNIEPSTAANELEKKIRNLLLVAEGLLGVIPKNQLQAGAAPAMQLPIPSTIPSPLNKLYFMECIESSKELKKIQQQRVQMPISETNEWLAELEFINFFQEDGDKTKGLFQCKSSNSSAFMKEGPSYLLSQSYDNIRHFKDRDFKIWQAKTYGGCVPAKWSEVLRSEAEKECRKHEKPNLVILENIKIGTKWSPGTKLYCTKAVYLGNLTYLETLLNKYQKVSVAFKPTSEDTNWNTPLLGGKINLLWGPPGSGKTHACCEILANFNNLCSNESERVVYVTAFTKQAIINIASSMTISLNQNDIKNISMLWLGKSEDLNLKIDNHDEKEKVSDWLANNAFPNSTRIIFGTVWKFAKFNSILQDYQCDLLIIEEGSQMPVMHALLPMLSMKDKSSKVLVIGDFKQLPPVRNEEYPAFGNLESSILHYWWHNADIPENQKHSLKTNWRMNTKLCAQLAKLYPGYTSDLSIQNQVLKTKQDQPLSDIECEIISSELSHSSIVIKIDCEDATKESYLVNNIFKLITSCTMEKSASSDPFAIVVLPHNNQIRQLLKLGSTSILPEIVGTVHKFQGISCDVAIISLGFLTKEQFIQDQKFLNLELINVATTRAKRKNIIILSNKLLQPPIADDPRIIAAHNHLQSIYDNSIKIDINENHHLMTEENNP